MTIKRHNGGMHPTSTEKTFTSTTNLKSKLKIVETKIASLREKSMRILYTVTCQSYSLYFSHSKGNFLPQTMCNYYLKLT